MQTDDGPRLDPAVRSQIAVFRQSLVSAELERLPRILGRRSTRESPRPGPAS